MQQNTAGPNNKKISDLIEQKKKTKSIGNSIEKLVPGILLAIAAVSILTTIGILLTLITETILFFKEVSIIDFFTGTKLKPLGDNAVFGILPLLTGTFISTVIAMLVAIPIGLMTAIYLSEYASEKASENFKTYS